MNNKFKLEYYFNILKDKSLPNREAFRKMFKEKYGKFQYMEELILKIERYQIKKYGCTIGNDKIYYSKSTEECKKEANRSNTRMYYWRKKNDNKSK